MATFEKSGIFHKAGSGGGGSDPHNLGWYADLSALQTAHPTGVDGDFAILGSTDTVWVWDSGTSAWKDTDTKGQVTSVNNQTGTVVLTASDVGALPSNTHIPADPVQADWTQTTTTALDYIKNKPTLGTAAAAATTDFATAAQGAKADTAVQPADLATVATSGSYNDLSNKPTIPAPLPSQSGNAGKFLSTDGTDASWSDKPLVNKAIDTSSITIGGVGAPQAYAVNIGNASQAQGNDVAIGWNSTAFGSNNVVIGSSTQIVSGNNVIAIGANVRAGATNAIQLGGVWPHNNTDANTFKVGNANGNFEIMSADGTIPADRLVHAINKYSTMPTAASTNEGWIVQYTGMTDSTYTHGHLYECVSDGADPATYSWTEVQLGGGGSSYTAGTGIDITSGVISVTAPTLVNEIAGATDAKKLYIGTDNTSFPSSSVGYYTAIGYGAKVTGEYGIAISSSWNTVYGASAASHGIAIGYNTQAGSDSIAICEAARATGSRSVAIGCYATATGAKSIAIGGYSGSAARAEASAANAIQIGCGDSGQQIWNNADANTVKFGNANGNFEIMSADGTIPEARLADTTSAQQGDVLTLDGNGNAVWAAGGGGGGGSSYTAGTGIDITSGVISVENPVYTNTDGSGLDGITIGRSELDYGNGDGAIIIGATNMTAPGRSLNASVVIGGSATTQWGGCIAIGGYANAEGDVSIAIGGGNCAATGAGAIQLGFNQTNADDNTFKVANLNGNFEIMDANGNLPADRLASTTGLADGNYRLRCTITNGVPTLSWVAE